ncbi:MAG: peptide chain release factor N(5)-glutamine methyltransferase, partial [Treponema sp.]|nr:peptide chain release factor N(5)-glutamine methyltransferase [Treponema sp.]
MTIREALAGESAALLAAGIESHGLDASLLLAEVLNTDRSALAARGPVPLAEEDLAAFRRLVQRRLAGESLAYIIGRKEFYGLEFQVNPSVLVPRPDTETLVEAAMELCHKMSLNSMPGALRHALTGMRCPPLRGEAKDPQSGAGAGGETSPLLYMTEMTPNAVLDLCTGSGAVAIALKHEIPALEIWAADISAEALETAKANAARLLPPPQYTPIQFRQG